MKRGPRSVSRVGVAALAALMALSVATAPAAFASIPTGPYSGDVLSSSSTQAGELKVTTASECDSVTSGTVVGSNVKYVSYSFTNDTGADQCVVVDYAMPNGAHVAFGAYLGSFVPTNILTNLIGGGDTDTSCAGTAGSFSFLVPAGQSFLIVVSACQLGLDNGEFTFSLGSPPSASYQADGRIRLGSTTLVGKDIYNADGTSQTVNAAKAPGNVAKFTISIQNDGNNPIEVAVVPSGAAQPGYKIKYFHGSTEISTKVKAGTYTTGTIMPGGVFAIQARVTVTSSAAPGSSVSRLLTLQPVGRPTTWADAVKFVVSRN